MSSLSSPLALAFCTACPLRSTSTTQISPAQSITLRNRLIQPVPSQRQWHTKRVRHGIYATTDDTAEIDETDTTSTSSSIPLTTVTSLHSPSTLGSMNSTSLGPRSKLILTRRVYSWTLKRRLARLARNNSPLLSSSVSLPPPPVSPPSRAVRTILGQRIPSNATPIESMLSPSEPVATFVFHRGYTPIIKRRRSADPPNRYLKLSYTLVEPFSASAHHCSNPRANGTIKGWYQSATRWNVLDSDSRPPLILKPSQRVIEDSTGKRLVRHSTSDLLSNSTVVKTEGKKLKKDDSTKPVVCNGTAIDSDIDSKIRHVNTSGNGVVKSDNRSYQSKTMSNEENTGKPISPLLSRCRWERTLGRSPRIIAIGDVHGCIDELQQLLRLADYQPGDQVVLLGDLVAKGPDSVGVVQLAREIGARSVRGNHDFEVVRWWESRRNGDADALVSVEHARIARALGEAEHLWLLECPWFIECAEMDHLFVHAGFIPGVKLTQQNPRLMMNMRSVLRDGTVTAKTIEHCEWAKLWKGPQTVVFGHDAVRGLQEYDYAKGIDTGCVYGGRLTALLLPENRLISVAAKRAYIAPKKYRIHS